MVYVLYFDLDNYDYNLGVYMKDKWLYFETFLSVYSSNKDENFDSFLLKPNYYSHGLISTKL